MKVIIFIALSFVSSYVYANDRAISASVYDADCGNFGNWKSAPYVKLQQKIEAQASCNKYTTPMWDYIYESFACEDSVLTGAASYSCVW